MGLRQCISQVILRTCDYKICKVVIILKWDLAYVIYRLEHIN